MMKLQIAIINYSLSPVDSNQVDSSIIKTVSNLLKDKNKTQFSLKLYEINPNVFTINPTDPRKVLFKGT